MLDHDIEETFLGKLGNEAPAIVGEQERWNAIRNYSIVEKHCRNI